ncbi:MAG: hypothetical protein AAF587_33565 [Bacteroidota bacterium]
MANTQNNRNYIILGGLGLATVIAFLLINYFSGSGSGRSSKVTVDELNTEILQLESSLLELEVVMETGNTENQTLKTLLDQKYDQITFMEQEIERLEREGKADDALIRTLRNKVSKARTEIVERYKLQINELVKDNSDLVQTIDSVSLTEFQRDSMYQVKFDSLRIALEDCASPQSRSEEATKPEALRPILKAKLFNFKSQTSEDAKKKPFRGRVRAKNLHTIDIGFTLEGNELVPNSTKYVYILLQDPDGKTYSNIREGFGGEFMLNGRQIVYSLKAIIEYKHGQPNLSNTEFTFESKKDVKKGTHILKVYHEETVIGTHSLFFF